MYLQARLHDVGIQQYAKLSSGLEKVIKSQVDHGEIVEGVIEIVDSERKRLTQCEQKTDKCFDTTNDHNVRITVMEDEVNRQKPLHEHMTSLNHQFCFLATGIGKFVMFFKGTIDHILSNQEGMNRRLTKLEEKPTPNSDISSLRNRAELAESGLEDMNNRLTQLATKPSPDCPLLNRMDLAESNVEDMNTRLTELETKPLPTPALWQGPSPHSFGQPRPGSGSPYGNGNPSFGPRGSRPGGAP